jgi:hypothetical protein
VADPNRLSVPGVPEEDRKILRRAQRKMTISEAGLARLLIHYGLQHLPEALAAAGQDVLESDDEDESVK